MLLWVQCYDQKIGSSLPQNLAIHPECAHDVSHLQLHFYGDDSEIDVETDDREFKQWTWLPLQELTQSVVSFKRLVYDQVGGR